jgi:hypothetical protein
MWTRSNPPTRGRETLENGLSEGRAGDVIRRPSALAGTAIEQPASPAGNEVDGSFSPSDPGQPPAEPENQVAMPTALAKKVLPCLIPLLLVGSLSVRAFVDVDPEFDTWGYHLPFAARLVGLADTTVYAFENLQENRFRGFPLLGELLQGVLWRATDRVQSANLVSLGSLIAFWLFLRWRLRIPLWLSVPALVAVPLIQIHATSGYIDLPASVALSVAALSTFLLWDRDRGTIARDLVLAGAGIGLAVNLKHLMLALGGVLWIAAGAFAAARTRDARQRRCLVGAWILVAPLLFATPLRNLIEFGNPVYPVQVRIGPIDLPSAEGRGVSDLTPPRWRSIPHPVRFLLSALEVGAYDSRRALPWVLDMGSVPPGSTSDRIGGYFFPNVLLHLGVLVWTARLLGGTGRRALVFFGLLTAFAALQPQSQQMRFSLYWMLVLVAFGSHFLMRLERTPANRRPARWVAAACVASLVLVVVATRGYFLFPQGNSLANHMASRLNPALLDLVSTPPGACVLGGQPNTFLYSALFHPGVSYRLKAAFDPSECGDLPAIFARKLARPRAPAPQAGP